MSSADEDDTKGGELLFAGSSSWSLTGRGGEKGKDGVGPVNIVSFSRLHALKGIMIKKVIAGACANHSIAITTNGDAFVWGRNETFQLGLGDDTNRYNPTPLIIPGVSSFTGGSCGHSHTLIIASSGRAYSFGKNDAGQCGVKPFTDTVTSPKAVVDVFGVVAVSAGKQFSTVVDERGRLFAMGCPQYGQLGNGEDGKMLEKAGKITFRNVHYPEQVEAMAGTRVLDVVSGNNHTVAIDDEGRIYTWGFGGYGRLGHGNNKDQYVPLAIEAFNTEPKELPADYPAFLAKQVRPPLRAKKIFAGSSCCYAIANYGDSVYFWGITKKSGEATMQPEPFDELNGWAVRSIGCGLSSTIVAADTSCITWGPSPTYGELGYGADGPKSSTKAREVDDLKGGHILQVTSGYGHALAILDVSTAAGKRMAKKCEALKFPDLSGDGKKRKYKSKKKKKKKQKTEK